MQKRPRDHHLKRRIASRNLQAAKARLRANEKSTQLVKATLAGLGDSSTKASEALNQTLADLATARHRELANAERFKADLESQTH